MRRHNNNESNSTPTPSPSKGGTPNKVSFGGTPFLFNQLPPLRPCPNPKCNFPSNNRFISDQSGTGIIVQQDEHHIAAISLLREVHQTKELLRSGRCTIRTTVSCVRRTFFQARLTSPFPFPPPPAVCCTGYGWHTVPLHFLFFYRKNIFSHECVFSHLFQRAIAPLVADDGLTAFPHLFPQNFSRGGSVPLIEVVDTVSGDENHLSPSIDAAQKNGKPRELSDFGHGYPLQLLEQAKGRRGSTVHSYGILFPPHKFVFFEFFCREG